MGIWEIIVGALVLIFSVIMIIVIILQEGHDSGLGTITGGADSFLKRGKAKTADALFARVTKYCAIVFFVLVVLLNALSYFGLSGRSDGNNVVNETSNEVSVVSEISEDENSTAGETTESSVESKAETSNTEESAVAESSAESVAESSVESVAESSAESVAESSAESVAESSAESVAESSAESVAESSAEA